MNTLLVPIREYLEKIRYGMSLFENQFGTNQILRAWHEGRIPKDGSFEDDIRFEMHGIGCTIYFPDIDLDFDFGPDNSFDGFDLWRLSHYVRQQSDAYPEYQEYEALKLAFDALILSGHIEQRYPQISNLYFLSE
jgi:hypothetical protein